MATNNASSFNGREQTKHEERMWHHSRGEQSLKELQRDYQTVHDASKRLQHEVEQSQANQVRLNASYSEMESAEYEAKTKMHQNIQYTKDLKEQQEGCQREGNLIGKKIQEGVLKNIAEEQGREFEKRQVAFEGGRRERREAQKEIVVEEERQRQVYNRAADDRDDAVVTERDRKIVERGNQSKILGDILVADGVARHERDEMISMIQEMEMFDKKTESDACERDRVERSWEEIDRSNMSQLQYKQLAARQLQKEEQHFRRESEKQMAREDALQSEKDRLKLERDLQYSRDLQAQIADNARRRRAQRDTDRAAEQDQFDGDQYWRAHASEGMRVCAEAYDVPQQASNLGSDVAKHDDNVRDSERQQLHEEDQEARHEREKKEKNDQYRADLQAQIADNARRRLADKRLEQEHYDNNQKWHTAQAAEERKKILEERDMNARGEGVGHDGELVNRMGADKLEDITKYNE